ncbi:smad nuclear-interacting protein 1-like [Ranitomeya imitator]|uniref:smad nuclear-interacting protein 1-like n=1 Tax=Ranitomeya imitator TaxID=111125 RepID=UPI0037E739AC
MKEAGRHKKRRPDAVPVKEERRSPNRRHRKRRSPSSDGSVGDSPAAGRRSRSPGKRKRSHIKRSRSPRSRRQRSESPPHFPVKIKQERDENPHRIHADRQPTHRNRHRDQTDRSRNNMSRHREREREENHFREQRAEREFHNDRRRERRQREEQEGGEQGMESDSTTTTTKKESPNFELSGALLEDTNTFRGVVIKYSEPPEARVPKKRWRLYPFKGYLVACYKYDLTAEHIFQCRVPMHGDIKHQSVSQKLQMLLKHGKGGGSCSLLFKMGTLAAYFDKQIQLEAEEEEVQEVQAMGATLIDLGPAILSVRKTCSIPRSNWVPASTMLTQRAVSEMYHSS